MPNTGVSAWPKTCCVATRGQRSSAGAARMKVLKAVLCCSIWCCWGSHSAGCKPAMMSQLWPATTDCGRGRAGSCIAAPHQGSQNLPNTGVSAWPKTCCVATRGQRSSAGAARMKVLKAVLCCSIWCCWGSHSAGYCKPAMMLFGS